jgi:hypothetical protein
MGPISIPLLLGMLRAFRRCGLRAALVSWAAGLIGYWIVKYGMDGSSQTTVIVTPLVTSLALYVLLGLVLPEPNTEADAIVAGGRPGRGRRSRPAAAEGHVPVPAQPRGEQPLTAGADD